jgi:hypothetical protein
MIPAILLLLAVAFAVTLAAAGAGDTQRESGGRMKRAIAKLICRFLGHHWKPWEGDFYKPYCVRCGKKVTFYELVKQVLE